MEISCIHDISSTLIVPGLFLNVFFSSFKTVIIALWMPIKENY